jgi:hypothetical protein
MIGRRKLPIGSNPLCQHIGPPFAVTEAPETGAFFSLATLPVTVMGFCATSSTGYNNNRGISLAIVISEHKFVSGRCNRKHFSVKSCHI